MILGLDVSTSVIGYTILDQESNVIVCKAWDLRNKRLLSDLYSKGMFIKEELEQIKNYMT